MKVKFSRDLLIKFAFPGILVFLFLLAVALGINGSSVGVYYNKLSSGGQPDKNLIFGVPQPVRGDEWLVITPMTASQHVNDYPVINRDIGNGQDMTVILDAPVKDWSTLLRPWNWGFFFMPLKNAFAFKWWAMLLALGLAAYLLLLKLFPRRYLFTSLGSLFIMLSPYVQWWYREYTVGLLAFGLGALVTMLHIHDVKSHRQKLLWAALLAYLLAGFAFIQYPPFEILLALVIGLFYLGHLLNRLTNARPAARPEIIKNAGLILVSAVVALAVIGVFVEQHSHALNALQHTAYPGQRSYVSGQGHLRDLAHLFASDTMPFIQRHTAPVQKYFTNQSEASLFMQYSLILLVPAGAVIIKNRRDKKRLDWLLVLLPAGMLLVFAYWFIPGLTTVFKPLFFNIIPPGRLEIAIGLLDFLTLLTLAKEFPASFRPKPRYKLAALSGGLALIVFLVADFYLKSLFPGLLVAPLVITAAIWMAAALTLILAGKKEWGLALLVVLSLASVFRVNPLYHGLAPLTDTPPAKYIQAISRRDSQARWVTTDWMFEGYLPANGARSLTGDYSYPQTALWKTIDPRPVAAFAYNRAVHADAVIDSRNYIELYNTNTIHLHLDPCSILMKKLNVKYVVTTDTYGLDSCLRPQASFPINASVVNIYKISP